MQQPGFQQWWAQWRSACGADFANTLDRLIREAEQLWHVDVRELKRLGALELSQILGEIPPSQRLRVNRWLQGYAASTRLHSKNDDKPENKSKHH